MLVDFHCPETYQWTRVFGFEMLNNFIPNKILREFSVGQKLFLPFNQIFFQEGLVQKIRFKGDLT